ncbi:MAG TPA: Ldh family oxidoreductase [Anaerolineae bacterium]|nr:Ldh family oxidoreductase [Anaerolineae bacterium]
METRLIRAQELSTFVERVLAAVGVSPEHAAIVADCLIMANLAGVDSHGVVRLGHYVARLENGTIKARPSLTFERRAPSLGILDGDDGLGHVVMVRACTEAVALAEENGSGAVAVKNSSHFGMAGFYVNRIVSEGFAGIVMTATDALLVPFGARQPFFGSNPIAIGFPSTGSGQAPTGGIPVILDMATTSISYGKIALAKAEGRPIPPDWGLDQDGHPTADPHRIVGLHPIAGPKGSGLAMIIDIFCSILTGMAWGPHINKMYGDMDQPRRLGHFVLALDIKRWMPLDTFKYRLGEMLAEFNALAPTEGGDRVYYPGQIEGERCQQRRAEVDDGRTPVRYIHEVDEYIHEGIPIDPGLYQEIVGLGRRFNVPVPG